MAELKSQVLGTVNGKLANIVFRQINGKTFTSVRPQKYNVTDTEKSLKVKTGFKNLVKFSSFIHSISILKEVWGNKEIQKGKRTYNKIFSHNKRFIKSERINSFFNIVPNSLKQTLSINNFEAVHKNCFYILKINGNKTHINESTFISVIVIYNSKAKQFSYQIDELIIDEILDQYSITIELTKENLKSFVSHENNILYHTLIQLDFSKRIIDWSESHGVEFCSIKQL